jgi:hypothetical protein
MMQKSFLIGITIQCVFVAQLLAQETSVSLPSINFWEITLDIVMKPEFASSLEISPSQVRMIEEMRSRPDLATVIQTNRRQFFERGGRFSQQDVYLAVDNIVRMELSKILLPEQIEKVKVVKLQYKFVTGYAPFFDREVLALCKLSNDESLGLASKLKEVVDEYQKEVAQSIDIRARKIVECLRPDSQRQFVLCLGNKYLPGIPVGTDGSMDTIPFPPLVKSLGTYSLISSDKNFHKLAGIDADQVARLSAVSHKWSYTNFHSQTKYKSILEFGNALAEEGFQELSKILTKDQMLCAARAQAGGEFAGNPLATLSRERMIAFLKLTENDAESIRAVARKETERHEALVRKLNQTTFDDIRRSLPEAAQQKLQLVFAGVWE